VPPHGYLAFYAWLRASFGAHAVIHMGKHGNLEWLPGKALALSETCYPEAALGPMPHVYPFIVNDPGEGTQAKRRAQAVIVDHLTPPLTRAESYGPLGSRGAGRRVLRGAGVTIPAGSGAEGRDPRPGGDGARSADAGIDAGDDDDTALAKLDAYLCELKEMQIRDGLHIFGEVARGRLADAI
jgi:cobaltochelatase CobN